MVPNGHLERAGEAPFARTRAAGWDTRWGTAGPGTSWVHKRLSPATTGRGVPQRPYAWALGTRRISGPPGIPGGGGETARLREAERLKPPARASFAAQSKICQNR